MTISSTNPSSAITRARSSSSSFMPVSGSGGGVALPSYRRTGAQQPHLAIPQYPQRTGLVRRPRRAEGQGSQALPHQHIANPAHGVDRARQAQQDHDIST